MNLSKSDSNRLMKAVGLAQEAAEMKPGSKQYAANVLEVDKLLDLGTQDGRQLADVFHEFMNAKTLGEVFDHPELYRQYPELRNMRVYVNEIPSKTGKESAGIG